MSYRHRRRVPRLHYARKAYGEHLLACETCLLGSDPVVACLKGAARYAAVCAAIDAKLPGLLLSNLRRRTLYGARLDFYGHTIRCRTTDCRWCIELWARVHALHHPGE